MKFKILEYRDPYAPLPEHFGGKRYAEGLVVEFYPENGDKWVGNFGKSFHGATDILEHPDGKNIIVVANGTGYVIDPETHSLVSDFGHQIGTIIPVPELQEIVFEDLGLWLIAIGREGIRWKTRRLSWDGIRSLVRSGTALSGEARDPYDESWHSFTVDLTNGSAEGGSYWETPVMKVIIAPQGFKGSLTAPEVARAIEEGVKRAWPEAVTVLKPMADGGEGTVQALISAVGGDIIKNSVTGPLGDKVEAEWGVFADRATAVIEMAAASGITLVPKGRLNPLTATTYGTGEMILAALERGCRKIIVGLGGSATNDGGAGMAQALGARLLDAQGNDLPPGGGALSRLARIDVSRLDRRIAKTEILAATDVTNPLCGKQGASAVYGPQKGAAPEMVQQLDAALEHYATAIKRDLGIDVKDVPGAGAAGGLGVGLLAFAGAKIVSGVEMVIEASGLVDTLRDADLVFTGEGRLDGQTAFGKVPAGVAARAKESGVPVIAIAGSLGDGYQAVYDVGVSSIITIVPGPISLEESMAKARVLIADAAERATRLFLAARS